MGGLGLRNVTHYSSAALIASFKGVTSELVRRKCVGVDGVADLDALADWLPLDRLSPAISDFNSKTGSTLSLRCIASNDELTPLKDVDDGLLVHLKETCTDRQRNVLKELCRPGCGDWLRAAPSPDDCTEIDNKSYLHLLKYRLGLPMLQHEQRCASLGCNQVMDVFGDHALACVKGRAWITRHDIVVKAMGELCRQAGIDTRTEERVGMHGKRRPGDLRLEPCTLSEKAALLDIGITNRGLSSGARHAVEEYFDAKMRHAMSCEGIEEFAFFPIIMSAFGHWEVHSKNTFDALVERVAYRTHSDIGVTKNYWRLRIQAALARGNGKTWLFHLPQPGLPPGLRT